MCLGLVALTDARTLLSCVAAGAHSAYNNPLPVQACQQIALIDRLYDLSQGQQDALIDQFIHPSQELQRSDKTKCILGF